MKYIALFLLLALAGCSSIPPVVPVALVLQSEADPDFDFSRSDFLVLSHYQPIQWRVFAAELEQVAGTMGLDFITMSHFEGGELSRYFLRLSFGVSPNGERERLTLELESEGDYPRVVWRCTATAKPGTLSTHSKAVLQAMLNQYGRNVNVERVLL